MSQKRNKIRVKEQEPEETENISYYEVFGVSSDASLREIKESFKLLTHRFHPDKKEGDASIFALVAKAYEVLSDDEKRSDYDKLLSIEKKMKKSNYSSQKKACEDFIKAQDAEITEKDRDLVKSKYKVDFEGIDKKRGFDREKYLKDRSNPLNTELATRRIKDLEMAREQDNIECTHPKLFEDKISPDEFNALFELKYKQDEDEALEKCETPFAFNDATDVNYTLFNGNYDDLYDENENVESTQKYGSLKKEFNKKARIVDSDKILMKKIKDKTFYYTHNKDPDNETDIFKKMKDRDNEDIINDKKKYSDNPDLELYGILNKVGLKGNEFMVAKEKTSNATVKRLIEYKKKQNHKAPTQM